MIMGTYCERGILTLKTLTRNILEESWSEETIISDFMVFFLCTLRFNLYGTILCMLLLSTRVFFMAVSSIFSINVKPKYLQWIILVLFWQPWLWNAHYISDDNLASYLRSCELQFNALFLTNWRSSKSRIVVPEVVKGGGLFS